jgi:hypothetical protein
MHPPLRLSDHPRRENLEREIKVGGIFGFLALWLIILIVICFDCGRKVHYNVHASAAPPVGSPKEGESKPSAHEWDALFAPLDNIGTGDSLLLLGWGVEREIKVGGIFGFLALWLIICLRCRC